MACRICLEPGGQTFCKCKGTSGLVHHTCLKKWLDVSHRGTCEICTYEFQKTTHKSPTCLLSEKDILMTSSVRSSVTIFLITILSAAIFVCMYMLTKAYVHVTIAWTIANIVFTACAAGDSHPHNVFVFLTCVTLVSTGFLCIGTRSEPELVLSSRICMYTLVFACAVWCLCFVFNRCANTVLDIKVYAEENTQPNVDTPVHSHELAARGCTQVTVSVKNDVC